MNIKTPKDVGHYIASTRKALKWSQTDLAVKIGKDQRFVSRLENDPSSVSFGTVLVVLNVLNIKTDMISQTPQLKETIAPKHAREQKFKSSHSNNNNLRAKGLNEWFKTPMRKPVAVSKKKTEHK